MAKFLLFVSVVIMGITYSQETKCQESVFIKHNYKIINHGMFSFYTVDDNQTVSKVIFSYSLDLKKKSFVIGVESKDTLCINTVAKNYLEGYCESDVRAPIQNGFHDLMSYPHFEVLNIRDRFYGGYYSSNPYTLW